MHARTADEKLPYGQSLINVRSLVGNSWGMYAVVEWKLASENGQQQRNMDDGWKEAVHSFMHLLDVIRDRSGV
jgi:hypothetical protein